MVEYLITRGADVNKVTFAGNTPLHTASGREMDDMAKLLMTHGANVNIANREGDIPKVVRTSEQVDIYSLMTSSEGKEFRFSRLTRLAGFPKGLSQVT